LTRTAAAAPGTIFGDITFAGFFPGAIVLSTREVVPIPEPGTVAVGTLLALLLGYRCRRSRKEKSPATGE
jgi:hypothetical protein